MCPPAPGHRGEVRTPLPSLMSNPVAAPLAETIAALALPALLALDDAALGKAFERDRAEVWAPTHRNHPLPPRSMGR